MHQYTQYSKPIAIASIPANLKRAITEPIPGNPPVKANIHYTFKSVTRLNPNLARYDEEISYERFNIW